MTHKNSTMSSLQRRASVALALAFLLAVVTGESEKPGPAATINKTMSLVFGVSQQQQPAGNASDKHATPVRQPKAQKMDPRPNLNITTSTDRPISLAVHATSANKSDGNRVTEKTTISPRTKNRRSTPHRKLSNHHYSVNHSESEDKRKIYVTNEDYAEHHQYQNYQQDYYSPPTQDYEDPYNTIPVDQNYPVYDGLVSEPHYESYAVSGPGYFGPPIPARPGHEVPPSDGHVRGCQCPQTRQMPCDNSSADFIALVGALGANLWALIQLIATSSLPFIIPLLVLKLILVPIGIMKFLALVKIFFKLFIILPFFVRHIYPAFTQSFNLHDLIFQKIQDAASHVHDHGLRQPDEDLESRTNFNASSDFHYNQFNDTKIWDLRGCPARVACELGAFLSNATYVNFPQKLAKYLSDRADRVEGKDKKDENSEDNEVDYEDEDEKPDRIQQQDEAFKAFVIALGKKWTQEQCGIYSCSVLF